MSFGYIRDRLDLKRLILFILSSVNQPLAVEDVIEATVYDGAITYFDASDAVYELIETGHIEKNGEYDSVPLYVISASGKEIAVQSEKLLPKSVRRDCQKAILKIASRRMRDSLISASTSPREDGAYTTTLKMSDDSGNILSLNLMVVSSSQGQMIENNFKANAEQVYGRILDALLKDYTEDEEL